MSWDLYNTRQPGILSSELFPQARSLIWCECKELLGLSSDVNCPLTASSVEALLFIRLEPDSLTVSRTICCRFVVSKLFPTRRYQVCLTYMLLSALLLDLHQEHFICSVGIWKAFLVVHMLQFFSAKHAILFSAQCVSC